MRNKAFRISQTERLIRNNLVVAERLACKPDNPVCNNQTRYLLGGKKVTREKWIKCRAKTMVDTPKPCSCYMCGNPRKYFGEESHTNKKKYLREKDVD